MTRSKLYLPSDVKLTCGGCNNWFKAPLRSLDGRETLSCPFCAAEINVYESMPHELRKQVYRAARERIEEQLIISLDLKGRFLK